MQWEVPCRKQQIQQTSQNGAKKACRPVPAAAARMQGMGQRVTASVAPSQAWQLEHWL